MYITRKRKLDDITDNKSIPYKHLVANNIVTKTVQVNTEVKGSFYSPLAKE